MITPDLYPLKFDTIFKEKIWGGSKIKDVLGKDFSPLKNCGETWEISGVEGSLSEVSDGALKGKTLPELIELYQSDLVGTKVYEQYGNEFPLLIKFIDAAQDLSIQVHPNDELAKERHNSLGKTEMWYIFQADENSKLITGFNKQTSKEDYIKHLEDGRLNEILNEEKVSAGDTFFIPAGRVHTIGKGLLLAEIQQSSDVTYRIYDFDRKDKEGNKRELHTAAALDAIDYNFYPDYKTSIKTEENQAVGLVKSRYFETNILHSESAISRNLSGIDSFVIYTCIEGEAEIETSGLTATLCMGNAILVPRKLNNLTLRTNLSFKMLETFIR
jgi:mannose-6-phosphate isomerase